MATNDVYQVVIQTNYKNKAKGQNVFFYQQTAGTSLAADAAARALVAGIGTQMRAIMTNDITYEFCSATNLFNRADIGIFNYPSAVTGSRSGTSEPPFVSVVYKFARTIATMRNGYKRFWGIAESDVEDGEIAGGSVAPFNDLLAVLKTTISATGTQNGDFKPIVVKRVREGTAGAYTYRLPENLSELVSFPIGSNASYLTQVSTQNSRKVGRGI